MEGTGQMEPRAESGLQWTLADVPIQIVSQSSSLAGE